MPPRPLAAERDSRRDFVREGLVLPAADVQVGDGPGHPLHLALATRCTWPWSNLCLLFLPLKARTLWQAIPGCSGADRCSALSPSAPQLLSLSAPSQGASGSEHGCARPGQQGLRCCAALLCLVPTSNASCCAASCGVQRGQLLGTCTCILAPCTLSNPPTHLRPPAPSPACSWCPPALPTTWPRCRSTLTGRSAGGASCWWAAASSTCLARGSTYIC
jgi:hypothetical protein